VIFQLIAQELERFVSLQLELQAMQLRFEQAKQELAAVEKELREYKDGKDKQD
jgi:hypothetical protein